MKNAISGFSKKTKSEKIDWLIATYFHDNPTAREILSSYENSDQALQQLHDDFIENSISNFYLPLGVAPNFLINGENYVLPMVIEESSVVAAAAKTAKYWSERGGFKTTLLGEEKVGQIHFIFKGDSDKLSRFIDEKKNDFIQELKPLTQKMEQRGGGIKSIELRNKTADIPHYFQLHLCFLTKDAMGANFINSCLEQLADNVVAHIEQSEHFSVEEKKIEIVMSILSNYVPNCRVKAELSCPIEALEKEDGLTQREFAEKFVRAVQIAKVEPYRAVTHNKGIMNGVDAVVLATGNDFRAVEAGVHAFAARDGQYRSLSSAYIKNDVFHFEIELPLAVGTVGGLTKLHPLVRWSLELLNNPNAAQLMELITVAGLAQNFAAVRSLVTSGIQKGHMKMHLLNILNQLNATTAQKEAALIHFKTVAVSHAAVHSFLGLDQ